MRAPLRIFLRQTLCRIFGQTLGQKPSGPAAPRVFGRGSGLRCGFGFAFGKSFGVPSIYSLGNRLRTLGTSLGNSFTTLHPRLFNRLYHSNKISTVQFGIQLCHTDPRLSCSFSTLNPRADIDRWDFHSVCLFTVDRIPE